MQVTIAAGPGLTDSGVSIALDVLRAANAITSRLHPKAPPPFDVRVASRDGRPITLASGLRLGGLVADRSRRSSEVWLIPGTWAETEADVEGWLNGRDFAALAHTLERAAGRGARLYGSCTGAYAVAATGLLDGLTATTSWWLCGPFRRHFPAVELDPRQALIAHRRAATAGAVFAQADLALHLVRTSIGPTVAGLVTRHLLLDEHPSQGAYMAVHQQQVNDPLLAKAERYLRQDLAAAHDVPSLAKAIGASPRTLARRTQAALGLSPGRWLRRLRVEAAAIALETSGRSVEEVAVDVGLGSSATLRRELRRELGRSPSELRRRRPGSSRGAAPRQGVKAKQ